MCPQAKPMYFFYTKQATKKLVSAQTCEDSFCIMCPSMLAKAGSSIFDKSGSQVPSLYANSWANVNGGVSVKSSMRTQPAEKTSMAGVNSAALLSTKSGHRLFCQLCTIRICIKKCVFTKTRSKFFSSVSLDLTPLTHTAHLTRCPFISQSFRNQCTMHSQGPFRPPFQLKKSF